MGDEDRKHTSGGIFVEVDSNLGAVVGAEEEATESIPGNEGRIAQARVNVRGELRVFSVHFWHSEGWTPRNEALLEAVVNQAKGTRHPWLITCDANMSPEEFEKSLWLQREQMHVVAPKEASTCRSKGLKGEWFESTCEYVAACHSFRGEISQMKVEEDFESRPHKAVSFVKEVQEWDEQKLPKVLLGYGEAGCQEEAQKKEAEEKRRQRRNADRDTS